jgi:protein subunit release factor B
MGITDISYLRRLAGGQRVAQTAITVVNKTEEFLRYTHEVSQTMNVCQYSFARALNARKRLKATRIYSGVSILSLT